MVRASLDRSWPYYTNSCLVWVFILATELFHKPIVGFWLVYAVIPVIDQVIAWDDVNPTPEEEKVLKNQLRWKFPIFAYVFSEWFAVFWAMHLVNREELGLIDTVVMILFVAHTSAIGFLIAHELFHKRDWFGKLVGTLDMLKSLYMHFYDEHLYGHHKYVATPEDPATAKKGQSLYNFIPNAIRASFLHTWERQVTSLRKKGKSEWSLQNRLIMCLSIEVGFTLLILVALGLKSFLVFVVQALLSVFLLETINYIRHYGLARKETEPGVYEKVTIKHSWNAPQYVQNLFLLKLQRHSDHHAYSFKPYQILSSYPESPCLPCGYAVCVIAALFPKTWFAMIDPLVDATNANGKPSKDQMEQSTSVLHSFLTKQACLMTALLILV